VTPTVAVLKVTLVDATDHPTFWVALHEAFIQLTIVAELATVGRK
jgi:hypothetical protein